MKKHHTKEKGDLGVYKAQCDLFEKGYSIFTTQSEHYPFDLIIYKDNTFKKVQVKYRSINSKGVIEIKLATTWSDKNGIHESLYDKNDIDIICVYCPNTDKCYYINALLVNECVTLRVKPLENTQKNNPSINFADNFLQIPN
jgi:hypothetical protein